MPHFKKGRANVCTIEVSSEPSKLCCNTKEEDSVSKFDYLFDISHAKDLETMKYEVNKAFF